jgi:hypothetical protein
MFWSSCLPKARRRVKKICLEIRTKQELTRRSGEARKRVRTESLREAGASKDRDKERR